MPRRRISHLFALFVAFVVLMASTAWLTGIFGYGEIATDIPFLLAARSCFQPGASTGVPPTNAVICSAPPVSATGPMCGSWKRTGIS
jgi:hypothetical protein